MGSVDNLVALNEEGLQRSKYFTNLVLLNVATTLNQHRLSGYKDQSPLASIDQNQITTLQLERLFKPLLKKNEFWKQKAEWIRSRLDEWRSTGIIPIDCSLPKITTPEDKTDCLSQARQEEIVVQACAIYTANEWIENLGLLEHSSENLENLLGIQPLRLFDCNSPLFQDTDIEQVATGYPILTGAQALINNQWEEEGEIPYWKRLVGNGYIQHNIIFPQTSTSQQLELVPGKAAWEIINQFGPEAAYVLLIFSACATDTEKPWEQQIRLKGTDLIRLFGWDKRTDINLGQKLKKIGNLVELVCSLSVLVSNINIGAKRYNVARGAMWLLEELEYTGQLALTVNPESPSTRYEPSLPDQLHIKVRPGSWTERFLNPSTSEGIEALCQYGYLAKSTLQINPYRQRLASKLAIFLTIMSRIRRDGRYEVKTLLERLEPKELIETIVKSKQRRNTLITQWDNALLTLHELGWQINFDDYPVCIRPEWSLNLDDPEQTRTRPRNWLDLWLKAIVEIKPPQIIQNKLAEQAPPKLQSAALARLQQSETTTPISASDLLNALRQKGISQSQFARDLGVNRSLVTRWIKGERTIQSKYFDEIWKILQDGSSA